jgi:hypothetical protein
VLKSDRAQVVQPAMCPFVVTTAGRRGGVRLSACTCGDVSLHAARKPHELDGGVLRHAGKRLHSPRLKLSTGRGNHCCGALRRRTCSRRVGSSTT